MIINPLKRPHLHLIKISHHHHLKAAIKVNRVAVMAVVPPGAITATGATGASAHKTVALVPKPTPVQFWDHPMAPIVLKLRSHSHAILMLAPTAADKQPLPLFIYL